MAEDITIYTDGACVGNPGRGGYAYYQYVVRDSLKTIKSDGHSVKIYSDLQFVVNMFNNKSVTPSSKNFDIWGEILYEAGRQHKVEMIWVKGHTGIEGNEICNQLAEDAARNWSNTLIDEPYEQGTTDIYVNQEKLEREVEKQWNLFNQ